MISNAYAAEAAAQDGALGTIIMLVGFVFIFYFLLWRPQNKRAKEHRDLVSGLSSGDEVITSGGVLGKIAKLQDDFVSLKISDNTEIKLQRTAISKVLPKGTLKSI